MDPLCSDNPAIFCSQGAISVPFITRTMQGSFLLTFQTTSYRLLHQAFPEPQGQPLCPPQ